VEGLGTRRIGVLVTIVDDSAWRADAERSAIAICTVSPMPLFETRDSVPPFQLEKCHGVDYLDASKFSCGLPGNGAASAEVHSELADG